MCCCLLGPFYVLLVFIGICSVFWLFWLSSQYLPSDWLDWPLWGSLTMARESSPESPGRRVFMIVVVYCILSMFNSMICLSCPPDLRDIYFILLWHDIAICAESVVEYQTNKQTNKQIYLSRTLSLLCLNYISHLCWTHLTGLAANW